MSLARLTILCNPRTIWCRSRVLSHDFVALARVFFPVPTIGSRAQVEENKDGEERCWRTGRDADDVGRHALLRLVVAPQTLGGCGRGRRVWRRTPAEEVVMAKEHAEGAMRRWGTFLVPGARRNALFCQL
jgi:hypothetical protein